MITEKKQRFVWLLGVFKERPFISSIVILGAFSFGYFLYGWIFGADAVNASYVFGTAERKMIIASVSASGQVSAQNEIDIKSKVSGEITSIFVKAGDTVRFGQAIATIDSTDARQEITDEEESLAEARLQLQKDSAEAPMNYAKTLESLDDAKADLVTEYYDTFGSLSASYIALPAVVTGMEDILYKYDLSPSKSQWNIDIIKNLFNESSKEQSTVNSFAVKAEADYKIAREMYNAGLLSYKQTTRYSKGELLEQVLEQSITSATAIAQALHSTLNLLDVVVDIASERNVTLNPKIVTMQGEAREYSSAANSQLNSLLAQKKALETVKRSIVSAEREIALFRIGNPDGSNPISLQSAKNNIAAQERRVQKLKADLADFTVRASFDGTIASFDAKRLDEVGTGSVLGTLITHQKIAILSLNEVDAAKIKVGNKATLSFDALEDLTVTGKVEEIDALGSVSQGVVSYTITISFDTQDDRIKPGMTVNASIITEVKQDVVSVPASAVKIQNGEAYVEIRNTEASRENSELIPLRVPVTIGISDDISTEVITGLSEGQEIIIRTITTSSGGATGSSAPTFFGGAGGTRVMGGGGTVNAVRVVR